MLEIISDNLFLFGCCVFGSDIDTPSILVPPSSPFTGYQNSSSILIVNQCILHGGVSDYHEVVEYAASFDNQPGCRWAVIHLCKEYLK